MGMLQLLMQIPVASHISDVVYTGLSHPKTQRLTGFDRSTGPFEPVVSCAIPFKPCHMQR